MEDELMQTKRNLKHLEQWRKNERKKMLGGVVFIVFLLLFIYSLLTENVLASAFFIIPIHFFFVVIGISLIWILIIGIRYLGDSGITFFSVFWGGKRSSYVVMKKEYLEKIAELEQKLAILEESRKE